MLQEQVIASSVQEHTGYSMLRGKANVSSLTINIETKNRHVEWLDSGEVKTTMPESFRLEKATQFTYGKGEDNWLKLRIQQA